MEQQDSSCDAFTFFLTLTSRESCHLLRKTALLVKPAKDMRTSNGSVARILKPGMGSEQVRKYETSDIVLLRPYSTLHGLICIRQLNIMP